jgi:hypothetical protein
MDITLLLLAITVLVTTIYRRYPHSGEGLAGVGVTLSVLAAKDLYGARQHSV